MPKSMKTPSSMGCIRQLLAAYRSKKIPHRVYVVRDGKHILAHPFNELTIEYDPHIVLMKAGKKRIFCATQFKSNTYARLKNAIRNYYMKLQMQRIEEE